LTEKYGARNYHPLPVVIAKAKGVMNTGAEAVETAIKMARRWAYDKKHVPADKAEKKS
jgi:acetylornithine/succinyldiaminopimelate/putrescine aminotransferase